MEENEALDYFRSALYIVLDNFTGSGHGVIEPKSETYLIISSILMIIGRLFECYVIGKHIFFVN